MLARGSQQQRQQQMAPSFSLPAGDDALATIDGIPALDVSFDNDSDPECTVVTVEGKDRSDLLMSLTGAFASSDVVVVSASIQSDDGKVRRGPRCRTGGLASPPLLASAWSCHGMLTVLQWTRSRAGRGYDLLQKTSLGHSTQ